MTTAHRYLAASLCLLLGGCHRRVRVASVPTAPTPLVMVSVPPPTHPTEPEPKIPLAEVPKIEPQLPRKPSRRYRQPLASAAQIAALTPPTPPVDLGQLTTGGEASNTNLRQQTYDLLRAQQRRFAALTIAAADPHRQQIDQARMFLKQANEAWNKLDIEGTRTLATKAKVVLDELQ